MVDDGDLTVRETRFLEPCRFHRPAPHQRHGLARRGGHPVLGLAPARDRLRLGRGRRIGPAAIFAVSPHRRAADHCGLADRRGARSRRESAAHRLIAGRIRRRLVDGLRIFCRRALVGRLGLPGRGRQIRLGAAARRCCPAGGSRVLSGRRICDRAARVVARTRTGLRARVRARARRMGARPPLHRLSLERPRHGARRQSRPGSDRVIDRLARAHVPDDRDIRRARDAVARQRESPHSRSSGARRARACADRRLRRVQAHGAGQRQPPRRQAAPDPTQRRPGRFVRPGKQGGDLAPLLRLVGARDGAGSIRGSRRHTPDLARVGVSLHSVARSASPRRYRRVSARRRDADHRRRAAGGWERAAALL